MKIILKFSVTVLINVNITNTRNTPNPWFPVKSNSVNHNGTDHTDTSVSPAESRNDGATSLLSVSYTSPATITVISIETSVTPPFPKLDSTPPTTPLLISQIESFKSEAYYSVVHNWTRTSPASRQLSVAIRSNIFASLPSSVSSMFLNESRSVSDRIAMIFCFSLTSTPFPEKTFCSQFQTSLALRCDLASRALIFFLMVRGIS